MIKARILSVTGGLYTVRLFETGEILERLPARGVFRHNRIKPLVGDEAYIVLEADTYVIDSVCERKNSLIRPPLANLDLLFVTLAIKKPMPTAHFADKLTVMCEKNGIKPVIVVTKRELDPEGAEEIVRTYKACGYGAFSLSSVTGEGISEFQEYLSNETEGKICAFAGASGVGKSTLLNRIFPELKCETGDISRKIARGKNTTRTVTLYGIGKDAFLADTPGFTMLEFEEYDICKKDELALCFPEFEGFLGKCKYTKCSHTKEEGCEIIKAVESGIIPRSRHESFVKLYNDVKDKKDWEK